jgi:hypothetical protein
MLQGDEDARLLHDVGLIGAEINVNSPMVGTIQLTPEFKGMHSVWEK